MHGSHGRTGLRAVPGDAVPGLDAGLAQCLGDVLGHVVQSAVAEAAGAVDDRRAPAMASGGRPQVVDQ
ncbi:hypothetical protein KJK32_23790 [Streptomyces sp. JCM17656]|nr:hypothetical protein KJK32_23790 [Streptomyces sp. JCM17656]